MQYTIKEILKAIPLPLKIIEVIFLILCVSESINLFIFGNQSFIFENIKGIRLFDFSKWINAYFLISQYYFSWLIISFFVGLLVIGFGFVGIIYSFCLASEKIEFNSDGDIDYKFIAGLIFIFNLIILAIFLSIYISPVFMLVAAAGFVFASSFFKAD